MNTSVSTRSTPHQSLLYISILMTLSVRRVNATALDTLSQQPVLCSLLAQQMSLARRLDPRLQSATPHHIRHERTNGSGDPTLC